MLYDYQPWLTLAEQMHRPPTYRCKPAAAPKLDGVLDDVCWAGAPPAP